jgi:hypothetical protein
MTEPAEEDFMQPAGSPRFQAALGRLAELAAWVNAQPAGEEEG